MNPFINPNKRRISLPPGCKDLIDVLNRPKQTRQSPVRQIIDCILMIMHRDWATELVIGVRPAEKDYFSIKFKVASTWSTLPPIPARIRQDIIEELQQMASLPEDNFPKSGIIDVQLSKTRTRWKMRMTAPDAECQLTRLAD